MTCTMNDIQRWLENPKKDSTHMLVVCDTWDYDDYPVYTKDVHESIKYYRSASMQTIMEVYDLSKDIEEQLNTNRVWNT